MLRHTLLSAATITAIIFLSACTSTPYEVVQKGEVQLEGHPYKTAVNCKRKAPIGKFDNKCDIPIVGWRGAEGMQAIVPQTGGGWPSSGGF